MPATDVPIPHECRHMIRCGALVAINSSGGKDSQAMTILLSRIVPREQIIVVHAPLAEVEWPGTIEHIQNTIPPGVPLILAPVTSGKSLLDSIEERGRFCLSGEFGVRRKPATAKSYKMALDRHILPAFGAMPLKKVGPGEVAALHHRMRDMPSMANRAVWVLSRLFNLADTSQVLALER